MAQLSLRTSLLVLTMAVFAAIPAEAKKKVPKPKPASIPASVSQLLVKRQYGAAVRQLELRANAGDTAAQLRLGSMYRVGLGVAADRDKAIAWLSKAAAAGSTEASAVLKRMQVPVPQTAKKPVGTLASSSASAAPMTSLAWLPPKPQNQPSWLSLAAARNLPPVIEAMQRTNEKQFQSDRDAALLAAARAGSVTSAATMMEAGANPNVRDAMAKTAILIAAQLGDAKLTQQLLSATPDLAAVDATGRSALTYAALNCDAASFKSLIDGGAKDTGSAMPAPVVAVTSCQNAKDFAPLLRGQLSNHPDASGRTAVWYAATRPDSTVIQTLLAVGGDPSIADKQGYLPMHAAAVAGQPENLRLLVTLAKSSDVASKFGVTPLMLASSRGCIECVRLLAEQSSDIDLKNSAGETALLLAVQARQPDAARLLLERGANPKARSESGDTPEKLASRLGGAIASLFPAK